MTQYKCSKSQCNNEVYIIVVGKPMCRKHWEEHCERTPIEEPKKNNNLSYWIRG